MSNTYTRTDFVKAWCFQHDTTGRAVCASLFEFLFDKSSWGRTSNDPFPKINFGFKFDNVDVYEIEVQWVGLNQVENLKPGDWLVIDPTRGLLVVDSDSFKETYSQSVMPVNVGYNPEQARV